ncbi:LCP family protein [Bacillus massilinigeriensis]|uniref:LCP family protein n=1 Tax=Bacillus massilionigeriensis TaxID=1805475 RepID=UPI00096AE328|nr:LCP family protein [Bacillus massilionigeriensis]
MQDRRSFQKQKIKKKKKKRLLAWILTPILVLALSATAYGTFLYNKAESVMNDSYKPVERSSSKRDAEATPKVDNVSVLFIGVDASMTRGQNGARSDALLLATFNKKAKSVKLLSIPRDSYVYIPSEGKQDKITHAHANGGPASTIETVEGFLDIPVDYYVKVNFEAFIDIVDSLGGVEVNVPYTLTEQDSKDNQGAITLQEGLQQLNGEEALALARTRHYDNDIERGKRQQEILKAVINKALSAKSFTKYADLMEAVGKNMETDLTFDKMKSFFDYAAAGSALDIQSLTLEGQDLYLSNGVNNIYYYQLDEANLLEIQSTLKAQLGLAGSDSGTDVDSSTTTDDGTVDGTAEGIDSSDDTTSY